MECFNLLTYATRSFDLIYTLPPPYNQIASITSENIQELGDGQQGP
jgi:DNA modification methylase